MRIRRNRSGFGWAHEDHRRAIARPLKQAAKDLSQAKEALNRGECWEAQDWYAAAGMDQAVAMTHVKSMGELRLSKELSSLFKRIRLTDELVRQRIYDKCGRK